MVQRYEEKKNYERRMKNFLLFIQKMYIQEYCPKVSPRSLSGCFFASVVCGVNVMILNEERLIDGLFRVLWHFGTPNVRNELKSNAC